jgi:hypothetical protein
MQESLKYEKTQKPAIKPPKPKNSGGLSERLLRMIRQKEQFLKERKKESVNSLKTIT